MHFSEIIKLQFEKKKCHTLLCILALFRIIVSQLSLKKCMVTPNLPPYIALYNILALFRIIIIVALLSLKMRGYYQFLLYIPIALAKICFS